MRRFGNDPATLTFAQQMQQQKLTGQQTLTTQQQQDAAARQQAQIQAGQAATSAFYANLQASTYANQDLARAVADRSAAWLQQPGMIVQQGGSNLPLILGLVGGGAVILVVLVMLFKAAAPNRY